MAGTATHEAGDDHAAVTEAEALALLDKGWYFCGEFKQPEGFTAMHDVHCNISPNSLPFKRVPDEVVLKLVKNGEIVLRQNPIGKVTGPAWRVYEHKSRAQRGASNSMPAGAGHVGATPFTKTRTGAFKRLWTVLSVIWAALWLAFGSLMDVDEVSFYLVVAALPFIPAALLRARRYVVSGK